MAHKKLVSLFFLACVVCPWQARASYLMYPAVTGTIYPGLGLDDCLNSSDGVVVDGGDGCLMYFPISIPSGSTISSVTVYYYDNSGSQTMYAYLKRTTLASDSSSTLASASDSTTSSSIQTATLSYGSSMSSSYAYWVYVYIDNETELRGIRVYY